MTGLSALLLAATVGGAIGWIVRDRRDEAGQPTVAEVHGVEIGTMLASIPPPAAVRTLGR